MTALPGLALATAEPADRPLLENLTQLYLHDFSELFGNTPRLDLGADGRFVLDQPLDRWWQAADHIPLLLHWHGHPAGFALVNAATYLGLPTDRTIAEFFVVRKYRRRGFGRAAASAVFDRWPGRWEVPVLRANAGAAAFWDRSIRDHPGARDIVVHDRDDGAWRGPVFRFRQALP